MVAAASRQRAALHCAPPLTITEEQLRDGFQRLDKALLVLDDGWRGGY